MWKTINKHLWRWRGIFIVAPTVTLIIFGLRTSRILQVPELAVLDLFFQLRPAEPIDERVVVVEINEADIQAIGYPVSDDKLAQVLNAIKQQQPRAIGLDLYRDLPIGSGRQKLVEVFQSTPNLIGIQSVGGRSGPVVNGPRELDLSQIGSNDFVPDTDGKIRRSLISLADRQGEPLMSLGTQLALLYLAADNIELEEINPDQPQYRLGKVVFHPLAPNEGGYVGVEAGGFQLLSNFRNLKSGFHKISFTDVLHGRMPINFAHDRVVLIGVTAISVGDFLLTPYSSDWFGRALSRTSGVMLHADLTSQLISAALNGRPLIRVWSEPVEWLWIFGWSLVGATIAWIGRYRSSTKHGNSKQIRKQRSTSFLTGFSVSALSIAGLSIGLMGGSYVLFLQGLWIPVIPGVLALFSSAITVIGYVAYNVTAMRQTLGRYLTDQVVANLLETPEGLKIGGERRTATILMSDLRGFSAISENLTPEAAMEFLNCYLEVMVDVITDYGGTINEILGDGIFVIFGAPIQAPDDAERAIACAIAMQLALADFNAQSQLKQPLEMGIGIHTGEVLAGNIGSQKRAKYAVVGKNVNLTSRIESCTIGGQVLISQSTLDSVGAIVQVGKPTEARLKGFSQPITTYEVRGIQGKTELVLPNKPEQLILLPQPILLYYTALNEKQVTEEEQPGSLIKLSPHAAELSSDTMMEPFTNLQIRLILEEGISKETISAKVTQALPEHPRHFYIHFTYVPVELQSKLNQLYQSSEPLA